LIAGGSIYPIRVEENAQPDIMHTFGSGNKQFLAEQFTKIENDASGRKIHILVSIALVSWFNERLQRRRIESFRFEGRRGRRWGRGELACQAS
jgi:hypothetical protein